LPLDGTGRDRAFIYPDEITLAPVSSDEEIESFSARKRDWLPAELLFDPRRASPGWWGITAAAVLSKCRAIAAKPHHEGNIQALRSPAAP